MRGARILVAVLGATLVLGGCSLQSLMGPDDKAIVAGIQSKLYQNPVLKARNITVSSAKGVVTLAGSVGSDAEKASAEDIANKASGVKQVNDQLTVATAAAAPAPPPQAAEEPTPEPRAETRASSREASASSRSKRHERVAASPGASAGGQSQGEAASTRGTATAPPATAETAPTPAPPPPPKPEPVTIPAGETISVQMIDPIASSKNHPGDEFAATLASPIVVGDKVVAARGANARVRLVQASSAGHMEGRSELDVQLIALEINGQSYSVDTDTVKKVGASRGTNTAEKVGGGAVVGALIGGLIGHGKGAAIGAGVGAGAGAATQEATKGQQVQIPAEAKIDFSLKSPITVTY
jgi:cobalamin biosynthesis Mg chelatase CobN